MRKKLICCDVFKEEVQSLGIPDDMDVEFLSMGLHLHPEKLHREINLALERSTDYQMIIMGFGLCGGALSDIRAPGCPLVIPKVHDCIPVLLGSKERYESLQKEYKGTFYFSGGWVEGDRMMIPEYERSCVQFGSKRALKIFRMMFENYNRLLYIHTGHPRSTDTLGKTRDFAETLDLPCQNTHGNHEYLKRLLYGPWGNDLFVAVPPDQKVDQQDFLAVGEQISIQGC